MFFINNKPKIINRNINGSVDVNRDIIISNKSFENIKILGDLKCKKLVVENKEDLFVDGKIKCESINSNGEICSTKDIICKKITSRYLTSNLGNIISEVISVDKKIMGKNIKSDYINAEVIDSESITCNNHLIITNSIYATKNVTVERDIVCKLIDVGEYLKCYGKILCENNIITGNGLSFEFLLNCENITVKNGYIKISNYEEHEREYWSEKFKLFEFDELSNYCKTNNTGGIVFFELLEKYKDKILDCKYWTNVEYMILNCFIYKQLYEYKFKYKQ